MGGDKGEGGGQAPPGSHGPEMSCIFHKKINNVSENSSIHEQAFKSIHAIQEYNYVLKRQWLFPKYHDALLVAIKTPNKIF